MRSSAREKILQKLSGDGEKTLVFFRAIPLESWADQVYSEGASWTILEIFKHLVSAEDAIRRLVENILAGGSGVPEDFDLDRYNESKVRKLGEQPIETLLAAFADNRARTVDLVAGMADADLAKEGRHPFLGIAAVEDILKLMYRHAQLHQRDIRRQLKGIG